MKTSTALVFILISFAFFTSCHIPNSPSISNEATNTSTGSPASSPAAAKPDDSGIPDTVICISGFLIFLFFLYRLFLAGRDIKHTFGPSPETFAEARQGFRESKSKGETWFLLFLCSPMFVRYTFFAMFAAVATAGFAAIGAICGLSPESLKVIFDGIERVLVRIGQIIRGS